MCFFRESLKFAVLAFGVIFLLSGGALVSIGAIYEVTFQALDKAIPETYYSIHLIPLLTIVAGSVITLFTILGCCGAIFNNSCLLITYAVLLVSIFIFQLSIGIFAFVTVQDQDDLSKNINATLYPIFQKKDADFINLVQSELHCCGTYGPDFWTSVMNMPVPPSCCEGDTLKMYNDGCQNAVLDFLMEATRVVGISVFAFSAAEVAGAVLAVCLANAVKKTARERRGYGMVFSDGE